MVGFPLEYFEVDFSPFETIREIPLNVRFVYLVTRLIFQITVEPLGLCGLAQIRKRFFCNMLKFLERGRAQMGIIN